MKILESSRIISSCLVEEVEDLVEVVGVMEITFHGKEIGLGSTETLDILCHLRDTNV